MKYNGGYSYSDFKTGLIYSLKLNINRNILFAIGSNFSLIHTKLASVPAFKPRLPGDGLVPPTENSLDTNYYQIDLGIWSKIYGFEIGFCLNELNNINSDFYNKYGILICYNSFISYNYRFGNDHNWKNSFFYYKSRALERINFSSLISIDNTYLLGITYNGINISPNFGINIYDKLSFLMMADIISFNKTDLSNKIVEGILKFRF